MERKGQPPLIVLLSAPTQTACTDYSDDRVNWRSAELGGDGLLSCRHDSEYVRFGRFVLGHGANRVTFNDAIRSSEKSGFGM